MNENLIDNSSSFNKISDKYTEEDLYNDLTYNDGRNVIINKFNNFTEIIEYKKAFFVNTTGASTSVNRTRKFKYDENELLQPARDDVTFNELFMLNVRSRRRSLDNFFGYALCNSWRYFITFTFDPSKIDRSKRSEVNKAWESVRKKLQYRFPDIKIILVSEEHKTDGCLHFHGLVGNCDLKPYLTVAINNMKYLNHYDYKLKKKVFARDLQGNLIPNKAYGHLLKTKYGDQIFNFISSVFNYGFSTVIELHKEDISGDNDKVVMYLQKYMTKQNNSSAYNKKCYYRTRNLNFKEKIVTKSLEPNSGQYLNELTESEKFLKKENDLMKVYLIKTGKDYSKDNIYSEPNFSSNNYKLKSNQLMKEDKKSYLNVSLVFDDLNEIF